MFGELYERALAGERCFLRHADGHRAELPVQRWLGNCAVDEPFDDAVLAMCDGSTIELGCGPGRLIARLARAGVPALGVDRSSHAVRLAQALGAATMRADVFGPLPGAGSWRTVLLIDGNVGLGADPERILRRSRHLLADGGHCIAEFDAKYAGTTNTQVRLETDDESGPWFPWSMVGIDCADELAERSGLRLKDVHVIGDRAVASMARI
ncbi:methyltransferase type 12 [Mycolicibacterium arabiense]|uniref:Methyltransferase type 12 n=1 Tax=Mycolicibacterium arabiense TaxID=1286181 RepID=A0A7I7RU36_9MYCO|nr:class I SAM-dependent methyltransferase [Mycolicibacterium arabiense]MBJ7383847.1 class I SAM-dependent methyltransferase [Mycolicibacterium sp.]MCV7373426.1 class I SAM-dependent methyltransferase [Mycolicibacterium arabiense]BBY48053.1 methyltransferase type 12 [Mycolicibacterium arabiense]